ncbi:MAG: FAD-binding oxidoreductase [Synechococcaceae cyanobacterium SM2_3_60]|nr:FAD-binding oxidoreductase [Synechococcaceae cyanobacterium SM2_3_60]
MAISLDPLGLSPDSLPLTPLCVPQVSPSSTEQAAALLQQADRDRWRLLIIGHGSKVQIPYAESVDLVVSTQKLTQIIDHAAGDLTVTAEAGLTFAALQAHLAPAHQMLALDPAFPNQATLGGIVATASTGARRLRYGGVRDMLLGFTLVRADGQIAHAGGRVVKNVAGYDLMKLLCGAWGSLGLITEMTWRLYPIPAASASLCLPGNAEQLAQVWTELRTLAPVAADVCLPATSEALGWGQTLSHSCAISGYS